MFKLLCINTYGESPDIAERMNTLTRYINSEKPGIVCMQELFTPFSRMHVDTQLSKEYRVDHAFHPVPGDLPALSYVPFAIACALRKIRTALFLHPYSILAFAQLCLQGIIFPGVEIPGGDYQFCSFMGSCTALDTTVFKPEGVFTAVPFPNSIRGYPRPKLQIRLDRFLLDLFVWFFQESFFRPHFSLRRASHLASAKTFLIVNCHLILGKDNPYRKPQMDAVMEEVRRQSAENKTDVVIVCGDFNADNEDRCFDVMQTEEFADTGDNAKVTWSASSNKYIKENDECDREARLDYVWFRGDLDVVHEVVCTPPGLVSDHFGILCKFLTLEP